MSAHKRALITPDSAALRRLDEISDILRTTTRPNPALLAATRKQTQIELVQVSEQACQRQQAFPSHYEAALHSLDSHVSGMDSRLGELVRATQAALEEQSRQLHNFALRSASQGNFSAQVEALLSQQASETQALIHQTQASYQESMEELSTQLQSHRQRYRAARHAAVQALHRSQAMLESLQQTYPANSDAQSLQACLDQAQANLSQGYFEAALSSSQGAAWQIHALQIKLEQEFLERDLLRAAALDKLAIVDSIHSANQQVSAIDLEGRSLDYPLDVDYWTQGGMTRLQERLAPIKEYLSLPVEALNKEDLMEIINYALPQIEQGISDLVAEARRAVLASQLRFNMAEAVLTALGEQGFIPAEASYQEGDMRQAYNLALHNLEGNELVVSLQPQPEGMQNQLDLISKDHTLRTPHELRQRARELARALNRYGLQVMTPTPRLSQKPHNWNSSLLQPAPLIQPLVSARRQIPGDRIH